MAALWFATLADPAKARAACGSSSATVRPEPEVATVVKEVGLAMTAVRPRALTRQLLASADLVVTIGRSADRSEVEIPGVTRRREHWLIPELGGSDRMDRAREVRDLLRSRIAMLVFMEGWGRLDISREAARVTRPRRAIEIDGRP
jgi:protein-tyrosine-phosphatase